MKNFLFLLVGLLLGIGGLFAAYFYRNQSQSQYIMTTTSTIVDKLQSTSKLSSATMTVTKILESQKDLSDTLLGFEILGQIEKVLFDDKMIMTVEGVVNAGIDLSKITTGDVQVVREGTNTFIKINLPDADIFDVYLTEKTKPFERSIGILSKGDVNLETQMRNQAIQAIRTEALSGTLLEQATTSAQTTITKLLHTIDSGYVVEYQ
ncbi:hypothetical protein XF24_00563 [candidate division SR1 bacterium Aalborg_AAW-1]|nr:hypothetical protein XF24_00563 [candidate division SR1 bacterium Aalborg_AAW-1]